MLLQLTYYNIFQACIYGKIKHYIYQHASVVLQRILIDDIFFLISEEILWYELCENTPIDSEQSAKHFGELANALQILHCHPKEWSEDNIISVLDELTSESYVKKKDNRQQ